MTQVRRNNGGTHQTRSVWMFALTWVCLFCSPNVRAQKTAYNPNDLRHTVMRIFPRIDFYPSVSVGAGFLPNGVQGNSGYALAPSEISPLTDLAWGYRTWLGKFMAEGYITHIVQPIAPQNEVARTENSSGFVHAAYGYTVLDTAGWRFTPLVTHGFGHLRFAAEPNFYHRYYCWGAAFDAAHLISLKTPLPEDPPDIRTEVHILAALRIGYAQYFDRWTNASAHNELQVRLQIGIGMNAELLSER